MLNITIHRGTRQIGGSCIEMATDNTRIIFDIGQNLPPLGGPKPDTELELPKVSGLYKDGPPGVDAVFISHGHGDHVGLIGAVHPDIPVFMGEKAAHIFNTTARFINSNVLVNPAGYLVSAQNITVGDFVVTPYLVDHSGFDSYAFVVRAGGKCAVYSGDLRRHGRKEAATEFFIRHLPSQVDALLLEGTMMGRTEEAIEAEEQIEKRALAFMRQQAGKPVLVLQSSTNIDRLVSMFRAAKQSGRLFVIDIFTANVVSKLGDRIPKAEWNGVRVFYPRNLSLAMDTRPDGPEMLAPFRKYGISRRELGRRTDYCILVRESMLSELMTIPTLKGSGFIYSIWATYLKSEDGMAIKDFVDKMGMEMVLLHTSGHADIPTLKTIARKCSSAKVIPIHTEYPARFAELFDNVVLPEDGQAVLI